MLQLTNIAIDRPICQQPRQAWPVWRLHWNTLNRVDRARKIWHLLSCTIYAHFSLINFLYFSKYCYYGPNKISTKYILKRLLELSYFKSAIILNSPLCIIIYWFLFGTLLELAWTELQWTNTIRSSISVVKQNVRHPNSQTLHLNCMQNSAKKMRPGRNDLGAVKRSLLFREFQNEKFV